MNGAGSLCGAGLQALACILILALSFSVTGCTMVPQGKKWWNPTTWFSARESTSLQAAQQRQAAGEQKEDVAFRQAVHASHIEFVKANIVISFMVTSPDVELARRFMRNGVSLLAQIDPLAVAEANEIYTLVQDLRSGDTQRIAAGEKKQHEAELEIGSLSQQILQLQAANAKLEAATRAKTQSLIEGFARENELADTFRNERFIMWGAVIGAAVLFVLSIYLRMGLGSVGAALHGLPKLIGQENATKVIQSLDTETDWFHQLIIGGARKKLAALKAKAEQITNS